MPALGLALLALYGVLAVGLRMFVQLRRTGSAGFKGTSGAPGSVEWICGLLFGAAVLLCVVGPALQLGGALSPIESLDGDVTNVLGVVLVFLGIATTALAQFAMGDAWRVGVDPSESTELVTRRPFSIVRNPIFAGMIPSFTGIALLAPNPVTIAGAILLIVALELQTRLVEEPYLLAAHGEQYVVYAARVGRFLPGIGRLRLSALVSTGRPRPLRPGARRSPCGRG
jgi:protein-S-isoprenylcysteine O-methyltransferase Ste14